MPNILKYKTLESKDKPIFNVIFKNLYNCEQNVSINESFARIISLIILKVFPKSSNNIEVKNIFKE